MIGISFLIGVLVGALIAGANALRARRHAWTRLMHAMDQQIVRAMRKEES